MDTFIEWLTRLQVVETYYGVSTDEYNRLFNGELEKVVARVRDPAQREALLRMQGFNWVGYIAAAVRGSGVVDQREVSERTHDIVVKLIMGKLFTGFDERMSGPMDLRFKRSVSNSIRNIVEKEKNRRRLIPTTPIVQEFEPGTVAASELPDRVSYGQDEQVIEKFRELVRRQLGDLGVAVLDVRLGGGETKSLVGSPTLGSPSKWSIKKTVQGIKTLARQFAVSLGDFTLLRRIERAMEDEETTVAKRQATTLQRVGA
jgi:hypothetical protein